MRTAIGSSRVSAFRSLPTPPFQKPFRSLNKQLVCIKNPESLSTCHHLTTCSVTVKFIPPLRFASTSSSSIVEEEEDQKQGDDESIASSSDDEILLQLEPSVLNQPSQNLSSVRFLSISDNSK